MDDDLDYLSPSFGKKQKERQVPPTAAAAVLPAPAAAVLPAPVMQAESSTPADEDLTYLSGGKPPPDYTKTIEDAKREANLWYGGGAGLAVGTGSIAAQKSAGLIEKLYERIFPKEAYASRLESILGRSSTDRPPSNISTPAAQGVVAETPVAQGVSTGEVSKAPGHERWLEPRSAGPIPKSFSNEMTTMTGGASVPGSGENILARNAAAVQKVRELGYNPLTMGKYGDILLTEPSKVRPKSPDVWTRSRASGPAPFVARRAAPAPVVAPLPALPATTAPASALPVAAAAAPEESMLARIFRKTAPIVAPVAKIGFSGLSGALGANQLYEADRSRREQGFNLDNSLDYLSGAGGVVGMVPTMPTQLLAAGLQTPAAINALRKYLQYQYEHPEEVKAKSALQNVDPMGNPY